MADISLEAVTGKLNRIGEYTTAPQVLEAIEGLGTGAAVVSP